MSSQKKKSLSQRRFYWMARLTHRKSGRHRHLSGFHRHVSPAFSALRALRNRSTQMALDALNAPHGLPPPGLDLSSPRWAMLSTGFPSDLDADDRSRCELIMGLAPFGTPAPDWTLILPRVKELFDSKAKALGSDAQVSLLELSPSYDYDHSFCEGRAAIFMPGFSYARGEGWWVPSDQLVDARRARRRSGRSCPALWYERFGDLAQTLWNLGLSLPLLDAELCGTVQTWSLTAHCVAQVLLESGCTWTARVPGFFACWPAALDDSDLMEGIDRDSLDPLRTLWALEKSSKEPLKSLAPVRKKSL